MKILIIFSCLFILLLLSWRRSEKKAKKLRETRSYDNSHIVELSRRTRKPRNRTTRNPINDTNPENKLADSFRLRKGKMSSDEYREKWG